MVYILPNYITSLFKVQLEMVECDWMHSFFVEKSRTIVTIKMFRIMEQITSYW